MGRPYKISEQDRIDICKKYQEGLSTSELSELYSIAVASIRKLLLKNNVKKTVINFLKNAIIAIYFLCSIL